MNTLRYLAYGSNLWPARLEARVGERVGRLPYLAPALALATLFVLAAFHYGDRRARIRRSELIAGLACVDWVIIFRETTPLSLIRALRPDVLAKGGDWALDEIVGREEVESWGGRVVRLREVRGLRSSALIEQIRSR